MSIQQQLARILAALAMAMCPATAQGAAPPGGSTVQGAITDDLQRLRSKLAQPGPEGLEAREAAIEQLLSTVDERAHAALIAKLSDPTDQDGLREAILQALVKRLVNPTDAVFGQRPETAQLRAQVVRGYVFSLVAFWLGEVDEDGLLAPAGAREFARACIVRIPANELREILRGITNNAAGPMAMRVAALRTAGDSQNLQFGPFLAEFVESTELALQQAARTALRFLTFADAPFERGEQYQAWHRQNGYRRYLELAEEAARMGARRSRQFSEAMSNLRRDDSAQFVRSVTERRIGIDWQAVQKITLVDDPATLLLCLQQLLQTRAEIVPNEDGSVQRVAFVRGLLQRYHSLSVENGVLRGALLEVAAYLSRPTEVEFTAELAAELQLQIASPIVTLQLAALRGIRRFARPEARSAVVAVAAAALQAPDASAAVLAQALQTLSYSKDTPWRAPVEGAPDKQAWLQLVREVCGGSLSSEWRADGLAVALLLDRDGQRVPEVFDLLLDLARDRTKEPQFRTQCILRLKDWRDQESRADVLVRELSFLLADDERDVRLCAAESLASLPEASEDRKRAWQRSLVLVLRERLRTEANPAVLRAMVDCLVACGREPGSPEAVIGALHFVLDGLGLPVPKDQQSRSETMLSVLPTVAADPRSEPGQWIGACDMLLLHEQRRSLRHVLESHNAVLFAKDVTSPDATVAERARRVMRLILLAALQKPARESWNQSNEGKREAEDVRAVFATLPPNTLLPENLRDPIFRLLRLDVLVAGAKSQEALALAVTCLADVEPKDHKPMEPEAMDQVRELAAEAALIEAKPDRAAEWLRQIDASRASLPRVLEISERTAQAFAEVSPAKALALLEQVLKATAPEDQAFRGRLVATWQATLSVRPESLPLVRLELDRYAALFQGPDCPESLKDTVAQLRAGGK